MSALELFRLALSRLRTSRLRAALTMLGVIIGVASVVALVSVGQGTTTKITERLSELGTNLLTISPTSLSSDGSTSLSLEDAEAIAELPSVAGVAPEVETSLTVTAGDESTDTGIVGTTAAYPDVRAFEVWQGTFLTDVAVDRGLRVAVLGASTAEDLGLTGDDLGTELSIGGIPFTLIGILPGHALTGAFFTATSMIGMIALAGIIVRNSILLVDFIQLAEARGRPLGEAVIEAGAVRFRPIALTAAAVVR